MSPAMQSRGKKITAPDNLYTVILALAVVSVLATAGFVTYLCYTQYETIFRIP